MVSLSVTGFVFLTLLLVLSTAASFFTLLPIIPLAVLRLTLGKQPAVVMRLCGAFFDCLQEKWVRFLVALLECVLGLRLVYTLVTTPTAAPLQLADVFSPPQPGKFKIVISNHRCRIDWLMAFAFLARTRSLRTLRIVLKHELSRIPVFGWSMQLFRYIFLSRKWSKDEAKLRDMIEHYRSNGGATILLYPEGTDLSESNVIRSNTYAAKNGLPCFYHVLTPRSTGFLALKNMIGVENIEAVIDVTMGYTDFVPGERPTELSIVCGRMLKKIHILCTRHYFAENTQYVGAREQTADIIPADDDSLRIWLGDRFAKKELLLSHFYASNPAGFEAHHVCSVYGDNCDVITHDDDEDAAQHLGGTKPLQHGQGLERWRGAVRIFLWMIPLLILIVFGGLLEFALYGLLVCISVWATRTKDGLDRWLFLPPPPQGDGGGKSFKKD